MSTPKNQYEALLDNLDDLDVEYQVFESEDGFEIDPDDDEYESYYFDAKGNLVIPE